MQNTRPDRKEERYEQAVERNLSTARRMKAKKEKYKGMDFEEASRKIGIRKGDDRHADSIRQIVKG